MDEKHHKGMRSLGEISRFKEFVQLPKDIAELGGENKEFVADGINMLSMYSIIYHGYTKAFSLEPTSIILLAIVATYSQKRLMCWHSQGTLAELTNSSVPTVIKHLKILEDLNLIERGPKHPRYRVIQWKLGHQGEYKMEQIQKRIKQSQEDRRSSKRRPDSD